MIGYLAHAALVWLNFVVLVKKARRAKSNQIQNLHTHKQTNMQTIMLYLLYLRHLTFFLIAYNRKNKAKPKLNCHSF
jgi:hypothetical protein